MTRFSPFPYVLVNVFGLLLVKCSCCVLRSTEIPLDAGMIHLVITTAEEMSNDVSTFSSLPDVKPSFGDNSFPIL
jgi:hypothetical protein